MTHDGVGQVANPELVLTRQHGEALDFPAVPVELIKQFSRRSQSRFACRVDQGRTGQVEANDGLVLTGRSTTPEIRRLETVKRIRPHGLAGPVLGASPETRLICLPYATFLYL